MLTKARLEIHKGHWWAMLREENGVRTWAPIGKVETLGNMKNVASCARLAQFYLDAGILQKITGPVVRENGEKILEVIALDPGFVPAPEQLR